MDVNSEYEIEFRWKEAVVYWEGARGVVFVSAWGTDPLATVVPDSLIWDRVMPEWARGRHDEIVARLRADDRHVIHEERDDSSSPRLAEEAHR